MTSSSPPIYITSFINELNNLGTEKNKKEFILSHNKYKKQIDIIDNQFKEPSQIDPNLSINSLFQMLEQYKDKLSDHKSSNLDTTSLKIISDIIQLLESKLSQTQFTIEEIN